MDGGVKGRFAVDKAHVQREIRVLVGNPDVAADAPIFAPTVAHQPRALRGRTAIRVKVRPGVAVVPADNGHGVVRVQLVLRKHGASVVVVRAGFGVVIRRRIVAVPGDRRAVPIHRRRHRAVIQNGLLDGEDQLGRRLGLLVHVHHIAHGIAFRLAPGFVNASVRKRRILVAVAVILLQHDAVQARAAHKVGSRVVHRAPAAGVAVPAFDGIAVVGTGGVGEVDFRKVRLRVAVFEQIGFQHRHTGKGPANAVASLIANRRNESVVAGVVGGGDGFGVQKFGEVVKVRVAEIPLHGDITRRELRDGIGRGDFLRG